MNVQLPRHILVGTDFSIASEQPSIARLALASAGPCRLVLHHVVGGLAVGRRDQPAAVAAGLDPASPAAVEAVAAEPVAATGGRDRGRPTACAARCGASAGRAAAELTARRRTPSDAGLLVHRRAR